MRTRILDNPTLPIIVYLTLIGLLATASGGVAPQAVENATPMWLTHGWGLSVAIGGMLAVVGSLTGRTRGESAGLSLVLFGLGLYALAEALTGHLGDGIETVAALLALSTTCLIRMVVLHKARRAHALAQRIILEVPPWTS